MMIAMLATIMYWRRKLPYLGREPGTVASVMCIVAGTEMVGTLEGLSGLSTKERDQRVREMKRGYGYGWRRQGEGSGYVGEGGVRWVVDCISGDSGNGKEGRGLLTRDTEATGMSGVSGMGEMREDDNGGEGRWREGGNI